MLRHCVAETCRLAIARIQWLQNKNKESLSDNPYMSVDPAPPSGDNGISVLKRRLLDEKLPLFDRYRAMFSLRNSGTSESVVALAEVRSKFRYKFKLKSHIKRIKRLEIVLNLKAWETRSVDGPIMISVFTDEHGWRYHEGKRFEDFLIVNISNSFEDRTIVMARAIQVGNKIRRISRRLEPLLVVFESRASNPLFRVPNRVRRNRPNPDAESAHAPVNHISSFEERGASPRAASPEYYHCRRYDWTINMFSFRWDWYAYPPTLNAGFCSRESPFPLDVASLNSTNHSFLKNRWRMSSMGLDESVPGECCTPISYLPASIIYISSSMEYVMREVPNMRVRTCGCL